MIKHTDLDDLCKLCKATMRRKGVTRIELSERTEIPLSTVNSFLGGATQNPSLLTIGPICSALGISLDEYFGIPRKQRVYPSVKNGAVCAAHRRAMV